MNDLEQQTRLQEQLARIRQGFLRRVQGELPLLCELLTRIRAGDLTKLVPLRIFAHRIRGTAATFQYASISECARDVETILEELTHVSTAPVAERHHLETLLERGQWLVLEIDAASTQG